MATPTQSPDDVGEQLRQGIRAWLFEATGLSKDRIVLADLYANRPELPYLMVDLESFDLAIGPEERLNSISSDDNPQVSVRGMRRGTVTINGYGRGSANLVIQAGFNLRKPSVKQAVSENNLSIRPIGPLQDISVLVDERIEKRFAKPFELQYLLVDADPEELVEPTDFEFDATFESSVQEPSGAPGPGDIVELFTIQC